MSHIYWNLVFGQFFPRNFLAEEEVDPGGTTSCMAAHLVSKLYSQSHVTWPAQLDTVYDQLVLRNGDHIKRARITNAWLL